MCGCSPADHSSYHCLLQEKTAPGKETRLHQQNTTGTLPIQFFSNKHISYTYLFDRSRQRQGPQFCPQSAPWLLFHCSSLLQCGRYAPYWNAFLFCLSMNLTIHFRLLIRMTCEPGSFIKAIGSLLQAMRIQTVKLQKNNLQV